MDFYGCLLSIMDCSGLLWSLFDLQSGSRRCIGMEAMDSHVSQSVDYIFSSHLGLMRCLTLIVRVSTQHHIHTFTNELGDIHKIILPEELHHGWNPKQSWIFVPNSL